ncbi:protein-glutamate methylesterase/protein-glutamine glutaminase [Shumkonia mesophila]|uniref:protein-glutamate methylesterase/protein-glutamine glutaminase n=1 Tax=Shumkonia mesophila TaxID=2838854 RepID=UPI002934E5CF|nr:chemotaxis response regulator protein-glutamate methylesterase [Shumkonia mesophila]
MDKGGPNTTTGRQAGDDPIRVMLVDDSAVVRGLITRMIEAETDIDVVASVGNGQLAVSGLARADADVVVLDIEMPVMDGLTALPKLLEIDPDVKVIMASTLTLRNAEVSIRALQAGAADYVPKPTATRDLSGGNDFRRELIEKIRSLGGARRKARAGRPSRRATPRTLLPKLPPKPIVLRAASTMSVDVLAIGSSTGGPQALLSLLRGIGPNLRVPTFITQHMPATFTAVLADHIARTTGLACAEAKDGEIAMAGRTYLAPGNFHMVIERKGVNVVVRLDSGPPENYCRPSVDPMLRSLARAYGGRVLTAILTGMGSDGLVGGRAVAAAGGTVIAQDEATSVVWGMPGAVATDGICSAVLPLSQIAPFVTKMIGRAR